MSSESDRYYHPSGAAPVGGLVKMFGIGLIVAVVASAISGLVAYYNPYIIISCLGPILCGAAIGATVQIAANAGDVRSPAASWGIGLLLGLVAVYSTWVVYLSLDGQLVYMPRAIWDLLEFNAHNGVWSLGEFTPTGWQLYLVWGIEAASIIAFAGVLAGAATTTYCESCGCWTEKKIEHTLFEAASDRKAFKRDLEAERYDALSALNRATDESPEVMETIVYCCPQCSESNFLSMNHTPMETDKEGKRRKTATNAIVDNLKIPQNIVEQLAQPTAEAG